VVMTQLVCHACAYMVANVRFWDTSCCTSTFISSCAITHSIAASTSSALLTVISRRPAHATATPVTERLSLVTTMVKLRKLNEPNVCCS
jgi:hypothetical protein